MAIVMADLKLLDLGGGPPPGMQRWLGLARPDRSSLVLFTLLAVVVGWLPLMLIGAWNDCAAGAQQPCSPMYDFSVHARSLLGVSLLILAEGICSPRLGAIALQFHVGDLVRPEDEARYVAALYSTLRLRDSILTNIALVATAYALIAALEYSALTVELPPWHRLETTASLRHSLAGWWHQLVSLPILLTLLLGWLWRVMLWARFLYLMARLDLHLLPVHPDRLGGLRFVGYSAKAYSLLGFTIGAIAAGSCANKVVYAGMSPLAFKYLVGGILLAVLALLIGPLLVFGPQLLRTWRRGIFEYGSLANRVGRRFESKWLGKKDCDDALGAPDFSAAADLYQVVANAYAMRLTPVDLGSTLGLAIATALPFLAVLLLAVPFDQVIAMVIGLLF